LSTDVMTPRIERFLRAKRIALVGATDKKEKWGYKILKALQGRGYEVLPVHPSLARIDGAPVYRSLGDLPVTPDAVSLVVPPAASEEAVRACAALGIAQVWMQPGAESAAAIEECERSGLSCIHHRCILVETGTHE
jgi:predicted CoA-binding protein